MGTVAGAEIEPRQVDQCCTGSCANGQLEDLRIAAKILEGRRSTTRPVLRCLEWWPSPPGMPLLNGAGVSTEDMDQRVRLMFMNRLHESIAGTASMSLAAASCAPGSAVEKVTAGRDPGTLTIGRPFGVMTARVRAHPTDVPDGVAFDELGMSRTARRLIECSAFYPAADALRSNTGHRLKHRSERA